MVAIQKRPVSKSSWPLVGGIVILLSFIFLSWKYIVVSSQSSAASGVTTTTNVLRVSYGRINSTSLQNLVSCPYKSIHDLTPDELHPKASSTRHIVDPPKETKLTLICCDTTKGPINIAAHHSWAPFGVARFLEMVTTRYFSNKIPLMRCVEDFICQFGLAGTISNLFAKKIPDDPQWLPAHQPKNDLGVKRFQKGYLAYAGGGPRTRGRQLFVALADIGTLGEEDAPWEVPWGEIVGKHSFETIDKIYTGYGEEGPDQDRLLEEDALEYTAREFPALDYILDCQVVDEHELVLESTTLQQ